MINLGQLSIISAALIFSLAGLFVKLAEMPPLALVGWRNLLPFLVVTLFRPTLLRNFISRPNRVLLLVAVLSTLRFSLYNLGIVVAPMGRGIVVLYTWPLIFTLIASIFLGDALNRFSIAALILGFSGVLLMGLDVASFSDSKQWFGIILLMVVAVLNAASYAIVSTQLKTRSTSEVIFYDNVVGAFLFLPFLVSNLTSVTFTASMCVASYGLIVGIAGYFLLYAGMRKVSAATTAVLSYTEVVGASILGAVVFGASVTWRMLTSASMILTAAFLVRNQPRPG